MPESIFTPWIGVSLITYRTVRCSSLRGVLSVSGVVGVEIGWLKWSFICNGQKWRSGYCGCPSSCPSPQSEKTRELAGLEWHKMLTITSNTNTLPLIKYSPMSSFVWCTIDPGVCSWVLWRDFNIRLIHTECSLHKPLPEHKDSSNNEWICFMSINTFVQSKTVKMSYSTKKGSYVPPDHLTWLGSMDLELKFPGQDTWSGKTQHS